MLNIGRAKYWGQIDPKGGGGSKSTLVEYVVLLKYSETASQPVL